MNKKYIKNILKVFLKNDDTLNNMLKEVFKQQKKTLNKFLDFISKLFINYGEDGVLNISRFKKRIIKKKFNKMLETELKVASEFEIKVLKNILDNTYDNTYNGQLSFISKSYKIKNNFKPIKQEHINAVVNTSYKSEMYSDRIWKNKNKMITVLKEELNKAMQGKGNINTISSNIKKEFNVQAYESRRLAITEMARVQSTANEDIAKNLAIKEQLFDATLDVKTSARCRELDGTYWNINDRNKPIPPLHPNCRSCLINVPYEGWKPTKKWDNENKKIIDYKKVNDT